MPGEDARSYWEGVPRADGSQRRPADLLAEPANTPTVTVNVPDDRDVFGSSAGRSLSYVVVICHPTSSSNPRPDYALPTGRSIPHMLRGGDAPLWPDATTRFPVLLFSHGYSGSPISNDYIQAVSRHGELRLRRRGAISHGRHVPERRGSPNGYRCPVPGDALRAVQRLAGAAAPRAVGDARPRARATAVARSRRRDAGRRLRREHGRRIDPADGRGAHDDDVRAGVGAHHVRFPTQGGGRLRAVFRGNHLPGLRALRSRVSTA